MGEGPEGVRCGRCGSTDLKRLPSTFACHDGNKDWYHEEYLEIKADDQKQIDKEKAETRLKHKEWERNRKEKKRAEETKRTYSIKE